ncbi:MAG: hypothetical protein JSU70_17095 [Phycisphaerales bacterium]|nr:MAG: hypothetical protein JSU70_17095 [Phycisphaerales bacterium]
MAIEYKRPPCTNESIWPKKWRDTVWQVNMREVDLPQMSGDPLKVGINNETVMTDASKAFEVVRRT